MRLVDELLQRQAQVRRHEADLRDYQRNLLIPFVHEHPFSGVYVDMGLGKTVSILTVLSDLFSRDKINKALIIAPLRVAVQTWPTELKEWSHTWWMSHTLIRPDPKHPKLLEAARAARTAERDDPFGSPASASGKARTAHLELQRKQLARKRTMIHVINREMVVWLVEFFGEKWPYDCVIVDESTSFADHRTNRWKALNRVRGRIRRMHLLSGIPAPEGIEDYFAQIYLLDRGERFGRGITAFRERYLIQNHYSRRWTPQTGAAREVAEKIADICTVMREEDYLDIEKPVIVERPIVLDPDELKQYKFFEKNLILQLPDDEEVEAENAAALSQKLLQYASGAVYGEDRKVHHVHDHKLEEVLQLKEEAAGSPLLIAYWHRSSLSRLQKLLPKSVTMDREGKCVKDWNDGKIEQLLIHPASAGHGLNMQLGPGHILVFFDNPWALELYLQTIKRIARPGQKKLVRVYHLVTRGTLDATIVPALRAKDDAQDTIRRYIRDLRKAHGRAKEDRG